MSLCRPAPIALILISAFSAIIAANNTVDFWIFSTSPVGGGWYRDNSVIGYSWILDGRIFHKENWPFIHSTYSFLVGWPTPDMYAVRPMYPLLASVIAPLIGVMPAFLLVNVFAWGAAAYCAVRLTETVSDSTLAPWITAILIALSAGCWFHLTDYSAHMLSNCAYVVSVYVLARMGAAGPLDLRNQIIATAVLVAMALTYNTGLALLAAYVLFAILSGSRRGAIVTVLVVIAAQRAWPYLYVWSVEGGMMMQGTEGHYLAEALSRWRTAAHDPVVLLGMIGRIVLQVVASDPLNLVVVSICLVGLLRRQVNRPVEWFVLVAGIAPMAAALPWMSFAPARGYIANAGFGVLAVLAAVLIARCGRASKPIVAVLLIVQGGWLASQSLGNVHPLTIYSIGARDVSEFISAFGPNTVTTASLTGHEATPRRISGTATTADAGALEQTSVYTSATAPQSWMARLHVWVYRLYVMAPVMIAIILLSGRRRREVLWLLAGVYLLPPIIAQAKKPERFNVVMAEDPLAAPVQVVEQEVTLSAQAWEALQHASADSDQVEVFSGAVGNVKLDAHLCGQTLVSQSETVDQYDPGALQRVRKVDPAALTRAMSVSGCERVLRVRFEGAGSASLMGWTAWQRAGLPGRRLIIDGREVTDRQSNWPSLEIRIGEGSHDALKTSVLLF